MKAAVGGSFTGLLSLFSVVGRFFWSALSDRIGRMAVYAIFSLLGAGLYAAAPALGRSGNVALFCGAMCAILTMYGGGFAAIPAYLADLFSTGSVGGDPRPPAHGLERGRDPRTGGLQLAQRGAAAGWPAAGAGRRSHDTRPGDAAPRGLPVQPAGAAHRDPATGFVTAGGSTAEPEHYARQRSIADAQMASLSSGG